MRKYVKILFLFMLIIVLVSCSSETEKEAGAGNKKNSDEVGGELKVAYPAQPGVIDPHMTTAIATSDIMWHVYETLVTTDSKENVQPMLAESYEISEDGKVITFHLREGVLFHNGKEMVAEDVVASMNRWKKGRGARGQFDDAVFEVKDKYTVVLNLPEPLSTAFSVLSISIGASAAIMPKEVIEDAGDGVVKEYVGTGPFQFVEWKQDQHIYLTRFEEYQSRSEPADGLAGEKDALVDELQFIFTPDSSTQVAGLQTAEYDIAHEVFLDHAENLANDPEIKNYTFPTAYMHIVFNKKQGIFTNVKARQAIAAALDMDKILIGGFINENYYTLSHNMMMSFQEEQWASDIGKDKYNQKDSEKAKKLLEEADYNGEEIVIMVDREYEDHYNSAVVVQEQLKQIGMNVKLDVYDWSTVLERREDETTYDMYIMGTSIVPEPTSNAYLMKSSPGWTDSPKLDKIIEEFRSQPTLEDAQGMYDELQEWFWDYLPIIKIGDIYGVVSYRNSVQGFEEQNKNTRPIYWNVSKSD